MTVCMYMVGGLDRTGQDDATEKNASDYFWQVGASASFKKTSTCQMPFPSLSRDPAILVAVQQERRGEISRRHDSPERTYRGLAPYQSETYLSLHNMKRESRCVLQGKEKGEREHWIQAEGDGLPHYTPQRRRTSVDPSLCILTSYQAGVVVAVVARPCDRSLDSSVKGEGDPFSAALPSCPFMIGPAPMSTEFTFLFLIFLFFLTDHREEHASRVQVIILPYIYISLSW